MKYFSEINESSTKLYKYNNYPTHTSNLAIATKTMDWSFPEKYYKSIGYTVQRFTFAFPNLKKSIGGIINPKDALINVENGIEDVINRFNSENFSPSKKKLKIK